MSRLPVVLLVDDEEKVTASARLVLDNDSIEVLTATSAAAGMEVLRGGRVDVVVSDENMPGITGSEFLTTVRDEYPDIERIILTGQGSMESAISAVNNARVFRYLTKPCSPRDFLASINEAIASHRNRLTDDEERLDAAFSEALSTLDMVYQPIYCPASAQIYGYEALARVAHSAFAQTIDFVNAAARLNRQFDLDRSVRDLVFSDLPAAPDDSVIFVNLFPESLHDPHLSDGSEPLSQYADRVVLEITEQGPLDNIEQLDERLGNLRSRGFRLALDDLGAGYAGLSSFALMQPEIVKFDMDLIRNIQHSSFRAKLVSSIVTLCHDLGTLTVAEGVESNAELDHLISIGIELFQGYAIGRPGLPFVGIG